MAFYFSKEEVVKGKFLFISYSHEVKPLVEATAESLTDNGVRVFYDKAFTAGDKWSKDMEMLLRHENCCGAILFCDTNAIKSVNVAREREVLADEVKNRGDNNYFVFIVNVSYSGKRTSYMQLLKRVFDSLEEETIDSFFSLKTLAGFMSFVSGDPISCNSCDADFAGTLLTAIKKKLPQVIDENYLILRTVGDRDLVLGKYKDKPVTWKFLNCENGAVSFISSSVIEVRKAGSLLDEWLDTDFRKSCFTTEQAGMIAEGIRLLTLEEAKATDISVLAIDEEWWLDDRSGALQKSIRKDGTVYDHGYHNRNIDKGVRPVIVLSIENLRKLLEIKN